WVVVVPLPVVRMSTHQPPLKSPAACWVSSTTQRFHVPLGLLPLKVDSIVEPEGVGAGGSQTSGLSPAMSVSLIGRHVPEVISELAGSWFAAWSSKVRSACTTAPDETSLLPP